MIPRRAWTTAEGIRILGLVIALIDGEFLPEERAVVPVTDRGLLYGDGVFETLRMYSGAPFRWAAHLDRLQQGLAMLRINLRVSPRKWLAYAQRLAELNGMEDAVLRITVTRGTGARGYSIKTAQKPRLIMTLHSPPSEAKSWRLITSSQRVFAGDRLRQSKTCSKLQSVLARMEAEEKGAEEALLLNERGEVAEGAATNIFWIEGGRVMTPARSAGILPGITRQVVMELCHELKLPCDESAAAPERLRKMEGVFLTVSTLGVVEATRLDGTALNRSPITRVLQKAYRALVHRETGIPG